MLAPPNFGAEYATQFNAIFPDLAREYGVPLYPFFLDGVAANTKLNQADGMHPTADGIAVIVKKIMPMVEAFVRGISAQKK
jgi:acyl-CoA thioesterase-1